MALIEFTDKGLFCPPGNFYIDPWKPVDRAVITHAHSDHARFGSRSYLFQQDSLPVMKLRLGEQNHFQTAGWNSPINENGVKISFHPAGHVIGSAQVRIEYKGEIWVISGDYKTAYDGLSGKFEPIRCNTFITESTFGLPIYKWQAQDDLYTQICNWVTKNRSEGKSSVLLAYSLGKAQRVADAVSKVTDRIYVHGAVWNVHQALREAGHSLPEVTRVTPDTSKDDLKASVVIAPGSAAGTPWMKKFGTASLGICSGWMQVRGNVRRNNADMGFVISDHADWDGLLETVKATGAEKVFVTHGFQSAFSRYLNEIGIEAAEVKTKFGEEDEGEKIIELTEPQP